MHCTNTLVTILSYLHTFPYVMIISFIWHTSFPLHIINPHMQSYIHFPLIIINHTSCITIIHLAHKYTYTYMIEITHSISIASTEVAPEPDHYWTHHDLCNAIQVNYNALDATLPMQWQYECKVYKSMLFHDALIN